MFIRRVRDQTSKLKFKGVVCQQNRYDSVLSALNKSNGVIAGSFGLGIGMITHINQLPIPFDLNGYEHGLTMGSG